MLTSVVGLLTVPPMSSLTPWVPLFPVGPQAAALLGPRDSPSSRARAQAVSEPPECLSSLGSPARPAYQSRRRPCQQVRAACCRCRTRLRSRARRSSSAVATGLARPQYRPRASTRRTHTHSRRSREPLCGLGLPGTAARGQAGSAPASPTLPWRTGAGGEGMGRFRPIPAHGPSLASWGSLQQEPPHWGLLRGPGPVTPPLGRE